MLVLKMKQEKRQVGESDNLGNYEERTDIGRL